MSDLRDAGAGGASDATTADVAAGDAANADAAATTDAATTLDASATPDAAATLDATATLDAETADGSDARDPVVFIHGIGGSSTEFAVMIGRLVADGWPIDHLVAIDFPDPRWGCNVDNAETIRTTIDTLLATTGRRRVDLVAHSMGTLSSRHYLQQLGGLDHVNTYVTLGGLHHGNQLACLNPLPVCVWEELCPNDPFLATLNAEPLDQGTVSWVSICSRSDETASLETCHFDPIENIEVDGVDHAGPNGLLEHPDVYPHVRRVLEYP